MKVNPMTDATREKAEKLVAAWYHTSDRETSIYGADLRELHQVIAQALSDARRDALEEVLAGIAREQSYREYRLDECGDQDGSAIGACKEIAGYVRALKGKG